MKITMETRVKAPVNHVWVARDISLDITQWHAPNEDWHATASTVELRDAGRLLARMEAIDSSMDFDFDVFPRLC
jgi:uncharacterized protein YndB with AHSA1/START domain